MFGPLVHAWVTGTFSSKVWCYKEWSSRSAWSKCRRNHAVSPIPDYRLEGLGKWRGEELRQSSSDLTAALDQNILMMTEKKGSRNLNTAMAVTAYNEQKWKQSSSLFTALQELASARCDEPLARRFRSVSGDRHAGNLPPAAAKAVQVLGHQSTGLQSTPSLSNFPQSSGTVPLQRAKASNSHSADGQFESRPLSSRFSYNLPHWRHQPFWSPKFCWFLVSKKSAINLHY